MYSNTQVHLSVDMIVLLSNVTLEAHLLRCRRVGAIITKYGCPKNDNDNDPNGQQFDGRITWRQHLRVKLDS